MPDETTKDTELLINAADDALGHFAKVTGLQNEESRELLVELIAALMHWADDECINWVHAFYEGGKRYHDARFAIKKSG